MKRYKIKEVTYIDGRKRTFFYVKRFLIWEPLGGIYTMDDFEEYLKRRRNTTVIDTKTTYLNGA